MKRLLRFLCGILVFGTASVGMGENSCGHRVTIRVVRTNQISVDEEDSTPRISILSSKNVFALQGGNAQSNLRWTTGSEREKITVSSHTALPMSKLYIQAADCQGGVSVGQIPLSGTDRDFLFTFSSFNGKCSLKYTADAPSKSSLSSGMHTVSYTITDAY